MTTREYRQTPGALVEVRVTADGREGRITADVMRYGIVDDYRTTFAPGVFTLSLETRLPRVLWAHDSKDPIGQWVDVDDTRSRLRMSGLLDLELIPGTTTPAVPSAHRAWSQLNSGTIDQFSVGFLRQADERNSPRQGITTITQAILDEASPVLVGSVPGAVLVGVRSGRPTNLFEKRGGLRLYPTTRSK